MAVAKVLALTGAVTMESAAGRLAEGRALAKSGALVVDFSGVTESDSAALALLFAWQREAAAAGHAVSVAGLPAGLVSLAGLYGVSELLPEASPSA